MSETLESTRKTIGPATCETKGGPNVKSIRNKFELLGKNYINQCKCYPQWSNTFLSPLYFTRKLLPLRESRYNNKLLMKKLTLNANYITRSHFFAQREPCFSSKVKPSLKILTCQKSADDQIPAAERSN